MNVIRQLAGLRDIERPVYMSIGVFDGVHRGHRAVIGRAVEEAKRNGGRSVVLTFTPHPMRVVRPQESPLMLTSTPHKLRLIGELGVDCTLLVDFNEEFSRTQPADFIRSIFTSCRKLEEICVGYRWTFGHRRSGNIELIACLGSELGFAVKGMEPVALDGQIVSSTLIRGMVAEGRLEQASRFLGRTYSLLGEVVRGNQLGRTIGFPTANLATHAELFPPNGVYAVEAVLDGKALPAVANIGVRPTIDTDSSRRHLEVHVLGFNGDLYDKTMEVVFHRHLRPERKFDGLDALRTQIAADAGEAAAFFGVNNA